MAALTGSQEIGEVEMMSDRDQPDILTADAAGTANTRTERSEI